MGLRDLINRKPDVALAEESPPDRMGQEIGVAGESVISGFSTHEEAPTDKLKPDQYNKMRQNDGTVASLFNILSLPIVANDYSFVADEQDEGETQKDFVEQGLTLPPHKGGMTTPMQLVIADMTRAILEGFRGYEKVFELRDGKICYRKIAPRDAKTLSIRRDENGGFDGFAQRTWNGTKYVDVVIPREKAFLYTFGKERNLLYGESAFKSAYYHYDKKHKLYYLAGLAVQNGAIPPRVLKRPENTTPSPDEVTEAEKKAAKLGIRQSISLPPGWDVNPYESSKGRIDPVPLIDHHNAEMARSVLAQFLMLGTSSGNVGSWALSENHSDIFILALKGVMRSIESHINSYLIPDLCNFNFATPHYPEFKFDDMTDRTEEQLKEVWTELSKKEGALPEWLVSGLVDKMADKFNVEKPEDGKEEDGLETEEVEEDAVDAGIAEAIRTGNVPKLTDTQKKKSLAEFRTWRRPTVAEEKVKLSELQKKFDSWEDDYQKSVEPIWQKIGEDALDRLATILEKRDLKALDDFSLRYGNEYQGLLSRLMKEAYEYGKKACSDELSVEAPGTKRDTSLFISQTTQMVVDKQMADALFEIRAMVLSELRKNTLADKEFDAGDILSGVAGFFMDFFKGKISLTGEISVAQAINRGRDDVFGIARNKIRTYQYSAILDSRTCPICKDLDGSVVQYGDYKKTKWVPPIHGRCRCIWVAILKDELEPPAVTGLPKTPGGQTAPSL